MNLSLVVRSLAELGERESKPVCLAIGMFDGVHLGHRTVLELAIDEARSANGLAVALTFPEHPAKFLRPGQEPPLLMDPESKAKLLLDYGVDCVVLRTFDESFAEVSSEEFLAYLKVWDHSKIVDLIFLIWMVSTRASETSKTPHS